MSNWVKKLTVDKRIIKHLSTSTYENFPQALKELIINSYDADATEVRINIDINNEVITLEDNGKGMSDEELNLYFRIAGQSRKKSESTDGGRKVVGKFGVGFLSVFPFCKVYEIETSKRGSNKIINAKIDCDKYFSFEDETLIEIEKIPIYGGIQVDSRVKSRQYTKIKILGFTNLLSRFFNKEYENKKKKFSIKNLIPIEYIKWHLKEYLPIEYEKNQKLNELFKYREKIPFRVYLNNKQLYRHEHANNILELSDKFKIIGKIKFKYFIGTNFEPLKPNEARLILIRNLNVGVGSRTSYGLNLAGKMYGKLPWLTMEVNVVEGLNELINVSRDNFSFRQDYEDFKEFLKQKMIKKANELDEVKKLENLVSNKSKDFISDFGDNKTWIQLINATF